MAEQWITFRVDGNPAPQGSKRHVGNGRMIESSKAVEPWRQRIHWIARHHVQVPIVGPVAVALAFVMPRPKSTPKRTPPAVKRPDIDKLARAVLDAITGPVLIDDSQVVALYADKRIAELGESPGVDIQIRLEGDS